VFSPRIPLKALSPLCRSLSTMLDAGVDIRRALKVSADKSGNAHSKNAMQQISTSIRRGETIASAMKQLDGTFPPMLIDMIHVGEESGALPEVLNGLANHYENLIKIRREFIGAIAFPLIQFFAATFIIAFLLWLAGYICTMLDFDSPSFLGFELIGKTAAYTWLGTIYGLITGGILLYLILQRTFAGQRMIDPLLMQIPFVGKCMQAFALARFSWAFYLTQQTGMPITNSLDYSLKATSNGAFISASPMMQRQLKQGSSFVDMLQSSELFPEDFIETVAVAETSGTVPEQLHRISPQLEAEARRRLSALTAAFSFLIWATVATLIVVVIISVVLAYIRLLNSFMSV